MMMTMISIQKQETTIIFFIVRGPIVLRRLQKQLEPIDPPTHQPTKHQPPTHQPTTHHPTTGPCFALQSYRVFFISIFEPSTIIIVVIAIFVAIIIFAIFVAIIIFAIIIKGRKRDLGLT